MSSAEGFEDYDPPADNLVIGQLANAATAVLNRDTRIISATSISTLTHGSVSCRAAIFGERALAEADTAYLTVSSAGDAIARFQFFPTQGRAVVEKLQDPELANTIIGELPVGFYFGAQDLLAGLIQPEYEYPTLPAKLDPDWGLGVLGAMVANIALTQAPMRVTHYDAYRGFEDTAAILAISYNEFEHMTPRDAWKSDPRQHPDPTHTARLIIDCKDPTTDYTQCIIIEDPYGAAPIASCHESGFDEEGGIENRYPFLPKNVALDLIDDLANSVPLHML